MSGYCYGIVKFYNPYKGYGFVTPWAEPGLQLFIHSNVLSNFKKAPARGDIVLFQVSKNPWRCHFGKPCCINVHPLAALPKDVRFLAVVTRFVGGRYGFATPVDEGGNLFGLSTVFIHDSELAEDIPMLRTGDLISFQLSLTAKGGYALRVKLEQAYKKLARSKRAKLA